MICRQGQANRNHRHHVGSNSTPGDSGLTDYVGGYARTPKLVVERKAIGYIGLTAVYARTGNPLEYFGLKCGDSHDLILPTRLNASASP